MRRSGIILPNEHNYAEGNVYARMPGGYLRVMYPEPEMCLDLETWQEFCGFDKTGAVGDVEIEINSDDLTMEITVNQELPQVAVDEKVKTDYFGRVVDGSLTVAGPFFGLSQGKHKFSIDPRKLPGK